MSSKTRRIRSEAEERWPALCQFFGEHLHRDLAEPVSLEAAVAACDAESRKQLAREWWDWNATAGAVDDIQRSIAEGLGGYPQFESPLAARRFMNGIYDKLIVAIRIDAPNWRPDARRSPE